MDEELALATPVVETISVDREKTVPFLIRVFVKVGGYHRLEFFEGGQLPTTDEHQVSAWKDCSFKELISALRYSAPQNSEIRHPLAKFSFRAVYPDAVQRGRISSRELGTVYSRDILGEPGSLTSAAPRLLTDDDPPAMQASAEKTLEDVRFIPGDYLSVCINLPKHVAGPGSGPTGDAHVSIRGAAASTNDWKNPRPASPPPLSAGAGRGRGGGHWRGGSDAPPARGRGGRPERMRDDYVPDRDRRVPPPRHGRNSPPPRSAGGYGGRDRERDFGRDRRSRSPRSRSRSPPRRRRYD